MAEVAVPAADEAIESEQTMEKPARSNPFASAHGAAETAASAPLKPVPMQLSALNDRALTVKTPSPLGDQRPQQQQKSASQPSQVPKRSVRFACCTQPHVLGEEESIGSNQTEPPMSISPLSSQQQKKGHWPHASSPKKSLRAQALTSQPSIAYSDAEWFDARSEITSLSSMTSDHAAKMEDLTQMLKDMHHHQPMSPMSQQSNTVMSPAAGAMSPYLNPAVKGPWIPEPALEFGEPNMHFMPVPAHTGFAAYWLRDEARSTPYPTPIDLMIKASALAMKSHESIPGIWLQETDTGFSVTVKPRFMPPGLPRYTETYNKSNKTLPHWSMRRDLRLGTTCGEIFMTTDGMLVLRTRTKPMFGSTHDLVQEEYMRLEDEGQLIVDRMCCMEVKSGKKATQYIVGHRYEVPIKGHV